MGDPPPVNCGIPVGKNKLQYTIPADSLTKSCSYSYRTEPSGEGTRIAIFEIKKDGVVAYRTVSAIFPAGSFEQVKAKLKEKDGIHVYRVKVTNPKKLNLNDYFDL